jgi:DNA-binding GntR family transcriptional regulator
VPQIARPQAVPLTRLSTVEAVVSALREQVLDGTLPAGSALREADICDAFAVSRHTVRTALQSLVHEGVLRHAANRGAYVPELSANDVRDVYRLRTLLELDAVRTLAGDHDALAPARAAIDALRAAPDGDWGALRDADLAFHRSLIDALGSPRTSRTYASLISELRLCFLQVQREFEDHADIVGQHERLLELLESGDADGSVVYLREHLDTARDSIATSLG